MAAATATAMPPATATVPPPPPTPPALSAHTPMMAQYQRVTLQAA